MAQLLVVEDEEKIGHLLVSALTANGYLVTWRRTGAEAQSSARTDSYDLALLDLGLPDVDGIDVCRELKRLQSQCVVVVLTARREEMDVVEGLESGADDYLTKPFRMTELLARVRAHLRRASVEDFVPDVFTSGDLTLDPSARRCLVRGEEVALRPKEFDLLARLASDAGRAVTREASWMMSGTATGSGPRRRLMSISLPCADDWPRLPPISSPSGRSPRSARCVPTATGLRRHPATEGASLELGVLEDVRRLLAPLEGHRPTKLRYQ
jgi:DNA-binding response OmpR family regulator